MAYSPNLSDVHDKIRMDLLRTDVERALDGLTSQEEGMRFQGLAVVLGKKRWPELIAHQRKKDFGLDAYAPASLTPDRIGKGLAAGVARPRPTTQGQQRRTPCRRRLPSNPAAPASDLSSAADLEAAAQLLTNPPDVTELGKLLGRLAV